MEIKPMIGWVVCQATKNGKRAKMTTPVRDDMPPYEYNATTGMMELFYSRKNAEIAAQQLNKNWGVDTFIVRKCIAEVFE